MHTAIVHINIYHMYTLNVNTVQYVNAWLKNLTERFAAFKQITIIATFDFLKHLSVLHFDMKNCSAILIFKGLPKTIAHVSLGCGHPSFDTKCDAWLSNMALTRQEG